MIALLLATTVLVAPSVKPDNQRQTISLEHLNDPASLERSLRGALGPGSSGDGITVPGGVVRSGGVTVAAGQRLDGPLLVLRGDANLSGLVRGNLVVLDGNLVLHPGAKVTGDALVIGGRALEQGGKVEGELRVVPAQGAVAAAERAEAAGPLTRAAGTFGVLAAVVLAGFGMVSFARPRLEVVSDTVARSFYRSFLIGVLAQIIALPTAALVVAGLVLSIVGILLLPFVALVVPLLLLTAVLGGMVSALHAMGEIRTRRRMAAGVAMSPNSYRYLLTGAAFLSLLWAAWVVFAGIPVAGTLVFLVALLPTWVAGTAGLGAFLLSRAGLRGEAAGRFLPPEAMTDEYLWATPRYGVTAVKRPKP